MSARPAMTTAERIFALAIVSSMKRISESAALYREGQMSAETLAEEVCDETDRLSALSPYIFS